MALEAVSRVVSYARASQSRWARQPPQDQHMSRLRLSRPLISHKIYITFRGAVPCGIGLGRRESARRQSWDDMAAMPAGSIGSAILFAAAGRNGVKRTARRPVKTTTGGDSAERQAVVKACSALVERLKAILQAPPQAQSAKVALWRLGLEQAIAAIEEYRGEVRDLLA